MHVRPASLNGLCVALEAITASCTEVLWHGWQAAIAYIHSTAGDGKNESVCYVGLICQQVVDCGHSNILAGPPADAVSTHVCNILQQFCVSKYSMGGDRIDRKPRGQGGSKRKFIQVRSSRAGARRQSHGGPNNPVDHVTCSFLCRLLEATRP